MKYQHYRFKFYINAAHAIYINGVLGERHPHTWEITLYTLKISNDFIAFNSIEKDIEAYLKRFQDVFINEIEPFTTLNPTLENICHYFKEELQNLLFQRKWLLLSIEVSETPTRSYIIDISDEVKDYTFPRFV